MLLCTAVPAFAANEEKYISALRIIYADSYEEAKEILEDSEFSHYKLLKENLNEDSDEIGVWLAYETTTNIEDAITDLAIMQMNGGYTEGNYEEMLRQSYEEYLAMGEIYVEAIEYFAEAYEAEHFLAVAAYRQLNFYVGIDEHEDERVGDIFLGGIDAGDLATVFLQGNSYALNNIRSLISMGVAYNESGKTYMERVGEEAAKMLSDADVYDNEDYDGLAAAISSTIVIFGDMFQELEKNEQDLNYEDEEYTAEEIKFAEYKAIAEMMRAVNYLGDKTLYQFCREYQINEEDYSSLYPLVAALNGGQIAMTKVAHYYDVVRYSMESFPEEDIDAKITEMEKAYGETPFHIYTGVDRSVFEGTFALTSAASRADAYSETGLTEAYFGSGHVLSSSLKIATGAVGLGLFIWAITRSAEASSLTNTTIPALNSYLTTLNNAAKNFGSQTLKNYVLNGTPGNYTYDQVLTSIINKTSHSYSSGTVSSWTVQQKLDYLTTQTQYKLTATEEKFISLCNKKLSINQADVLATQQDKAAAAARVSDLTGAFTGVLYIFGGAMLLYSAISLGMTAYNYYHPDYDDIPMSMVDLIETVDGDRYIKYDAVLEAETNDDGEYSAGDLNAFEAQRWNALYYTKSYEAGKPLLADEFVVSNSSNQPKNGYTPVHRFGEEVCYDLNKYNFDGDTHIYLSVKQSKNNKSAVADVPEVVGSMLGAGYIFLAGGIGAILGICGTMATQGLLKKKKISESASADS